MGDSRVFAVIGIFLFLMLLGFAGVTGLGAVNTVLPAFSESESVTDKCADAEVDADVAQLHRPEIQVNVTPHEKPIGGSADTDNQSVARYSQFTVTYTGSDEYTDLTVTVPEDGTVVSTTGFVSTAANTYQAQNASNASIITYQYNISQTDDFAYYATPENEMFSPVPQLKHRWGVMTQTGPQTACDRLFTDSANYTLSSSTEVTASSTAVLIGSPPHTEHTFSTQRGTQVTIVSPSSDSFRTTMNQQVKELLVADRALTVNESVTNITVFEIEGPRQKSGGSMRGGSARQSHSTVWVSQSVPVSVMGNLWVHEYVHTHQNFHTETDMRWFREASASYYSVIVPYQCADLNPPEQFTGVLQQDLGAATENDVRGESTEYDETVLAVPITWQTHAEYYRGQAVLYALDIALRESTNGEYTLMDTFKWANSQNQSISYTDFRSEVVSHTDQEVGVWLDSAVMNSTPIDLPTTAPPETSPVNSSICSTNIAEEYPFEDSDASDAPTEKPAPF